MAVKVAINGFGRIGRLAFRQMFGAEGFRIPSLSTARKSRFMLRQAQLSFPGARSA